MRIDKFLKVSRLIKRRAVAKEMADKGRVLLNGKAAKSSTSVSVNDVIEIQYGTRVVKAKVLNLLDTTKKNEASDLYELIDWYFLWRYVDFKPSRCYTERDITFGGVNVPDNEKNNGPRIFNGKTEADKIAILEQKKNRHIKEVHRVRRNWIFLGFGVLFAFLVFQIVSVKVHTAQITSDVRASEVQHKKATTENKSLKEKVVKLNDDTYVGKLIRYKYYYSKPGETIYNLPTQEFEFKTKDD